MIKGAQPIRRKGDLMGWSGFAAEIPTLNDGRQADVT